MDRIEPRHVLLLTESERVELIEELSVEHGYAAGQGDTVAHRLWQMPDYLVSDRAERDAVLSEAGERALIREVVERAGIHNDNPHADALRDALREMKLAAAYFDISIEEGQPGPERNAAVARKRAAEEALDRAALRYGLANREATHPDTED